MKDFRVQQILDHLERVVKTGELLQDIKQSWESSTDYVEIDEIEETDRRKLDLYRRYDEAISEDVSTSVIDVTAGSGGAVGGGGRYINGDTATIAAVPDSGYLFLEWSDESTDNPKTIEVEDDLSIEATFEPI